MTNSSNMDINKKATPSKTRRSSKRDDLILAGMDLLASKSIDALTIDEIVITAKVAKGSFYNHFDDKVDFFNAVSTKIRQMLVGTVEAVNSGIDDPALRMMRAFCMSASIALMDKKRAKLVLRINPEFAGKNHPLNSGLRSDVSSGLSSGRFAVATTESGMLYAFGIVSMTIEHIVREDYSHEMAGLLIQQMGNLMLKGLGLGSDDASQISAKAVNELLTQ